MICSILLISSAFSHFLIISFWIHHFCKYSNLLLLYCHSLFATFIGKSYIIISFHSKPFVQISPFHLCFPASQVQQNPILAIPHHPPLRGSIGPRFLCLWVVMWLETSYCTTSAGICCLVVFFSCWVDLCYQPEPSYNVLSHFILWFQHPFIAIT